MSGMMRPSNVPLEIVDRWKGLDLGVLFSLYNLLILSVSLLILFDVPRPSPYAWFKLQRTVRLQVGDHTFWGTTQILSEVGAEIVLTQPKSLNLPPDDRISVDLELMEAGLLLSGHLTWRDRSDEVPIAHVTFDRLTVEQHRCLVAQLFCRPGQWKSRCAPGELRSLLLLFQIVLWPRIIFNRRPPIAALSVVQT